MTDRTTQEAFQEVADAWKDLILTIGREFRIPTLVVWLDRQIARIRHRF